jgi:Toxin with a conserved tryptophan and TIP tripeptide motif
MSSAVQSCMTPPPNDPCAKLLQEILDLINRDKRACGNTGIHGLKHRFIEQINGQNGPGTQVWDNHDRVIRDQEKALERKLRDYNRRGCGDPPPGAWSWATRPEPQPVEWLGPPQQGNEAARKTAMAAGAAAATVGAGYVIYRVIRFLPSLFPPLWETIPLNLAVP